MKRIIYLSAVAISILASCSKDDDIVPEPVPEPEPIEIVYTVNRENQYALNVVFFKPSDFTASPTLIDNVSKMMLYTQKWYEKQMELQGFGKKHSD